jgi:tetratricopeptide (TPR) repeat protein
VVGLVAFLATIVLALRAGLLLARRSDVGAIVLVPLAAYLGQGLANVDDVATGWIPWVAFGVLAASTGVTTVPARRAVADRARRRGFGVGVVALTGVAVVATMSALPLFSASRSMSRTEALIVKGSVADAVASGVEAVRSDERRPEYWSSLGSSLVRTNPTAAASAFIAAATRAPWHPLYWRNLALVYGNSGNRRGAILAVRRAIAADRSDAEAHRLLANLLFDGGDFSGAAAEGEIAISLFPVAESLDANANVLRTTGEQAYDIAALAFFKLGLWDDAVRVARAGMTFSRNATLIRLRLAQAYAGAGKFDNAKEQLAIVLAEAPTNREALDLRDFLSSK